MSRRAFLHSCVTLGLAAALPSWAAAAAPFKPTRISVEVRGSGPDVVLIPGLSSSRGVWNSTVAAVPGYRYHLVQVAGFAGTSPGGNGRGPVAAPVAEEIAAYIASKGLDRPAVVGHSMGGSIAMMIAARHPRTVGKVMVVDMVPAPARLFGASAGAFRPLAHFVGGQVVGTDRLRRDLQATIARFGHADWLNSRSDADVVGRSLEELLSTDLTPELPRISAPLTVVYACPEPLSLTRGRVADVYAAAYARRRGTHLVRVERSGHTIMWDQPAAFQATFRAFLSQR